MRAYDVCMSLPGITFAVFVFAALCVFVGYVLPMLSRAEGSRRIEDSQKLSLGRQRIRAAISGVSFFFPAFVLSLPLTIPWARHQWPGDGQAVVGAFWPSVGIALISATCRSIYLLMKVSIDHENDNKRFLP
jgi:hypothetical protein